MAEGHDYPILVLVEGEAPTRQWLLDKPEMTLGRDDTCDIVIPNRQISRQHLIFRREGRNQFILVDLDSKNGTWVNGHRISGSRPLSDGDEIHIALKVMIRFSGTGATLPATHNLPAVITGLTQHGRLRIDLEARRVFIMDEEIDPPLSLPQYRLIELLYLNSHRICTREEVVNTVWPEAMGEGVSEQAIDALVRRLRDRLQEKDPEHQYIITVRGHGFRLENVPD